MASDNLSAHPQVRTRPPGRWLFQLGWLVLVLGLGAYFFQVFVLKQFVVPWYAPILATIGFLAMLAATRQRWTVMRIVGLAACALLAAVEWYFLFSITLAPVHAGPERGQKVPGFAALRSDGQPFTDRDLEGQPTVLLLYRGHW